MYSSLTSTVLCIVLMSSLPTVVINHPRHLCPHRAIGSCGLAKSAPKLDGMLESEGKGLELCSALCFGHRFLGTMGCGGEATEAASTGALIGTPHPPSCCALREVFYFQRSVLCAAHPTPMRPTDAARPSNARRVSVG